MNSDNYSAPNIEETAKTQDVASDTSTAKTESTETKTTIQAVKETVEPTSNEQFWRTQVDNYFKYLTNKARYSTDNDRITQSVAFMQQLGKVLSYDYTEMEDCVLYLIQSMRNNPTATENGRFFRFLNGVENKYPLAAISSYRTVATFFISVANSWPTRVKRAKAVDISIMTVNLPKAAQDNLNFFVRKMANYGIQ